MRLQILPPSPGFWDASTTPSVAPRPPSSPKSVSSSISSLISDANDDLVIQGSFPSANAFVARFALRDDDESRESLSGKRKVAAKSTIVQSEWVILERGHTYLLVRLATSLKLRGLWYAGVATSLGLELLLDSTTNTIEWGDSKMPGWDIHGSPGYIGYSHTQEADSVRTTSKNQRTSPTVERPTSLVSDSTSSLLRAPLPQSNEAPDFSFETNSHELGSIGTPSSSSIITTSISDANLLNNSSSAHLSELTYPNTPLLLHLEMTDIRLSAHSNVECQIYGTLLIHANAKGVVKLPTFSFPKTAEHRGESLVRSDVDGILWFTDRALDPIPLAKGVTHRCPENPSLLISQVEGAKKRVTPLDQGFPVASELPAASELPVTRTKAAAVDVTTVSFIPSVHILVTPMGSSNFGYAVKVHIHCASQTNQRVQTVECGLACASEGIPDIQIVSCTRGNRLIDAQIRPGLKSSIDNQDEVNGSEWVCWIGIPFEDPFLEAEAGKIELVYLIHYSDTPSNRTWKCFGSALPQPNALLPCFQAKVGCLEVELEEILGTSQSCEVCIYLLIQGFVRLVIHD